MQNLQKKQILKLASITSLVTIVSRVLGDLRDQRYTFLLGTSLAANSYVLAYRIPNQFPDQVVRRRRSFRIFTAEKPKEEVWRFANTLLDPGPYRRDHHRARHDFLPAVVHTFTAGSGNNVSWEQAIELNRIIFPYLFFVALAASAMGILTFSRFGLPAASSIFLNLFSVIFFSTALQHFKDPAVLLAVGVEPWRRLAIPDPSTFSGTQRHALRLWHFLFSPPGVSGCAPDAAAFLWNRNRNGFCWIRISPRLARCRRAASPRCTLPTGSAELGTGRLCHRGCHRHPAHDVPPGGGEGL